MPAPDVAPLRHAPMPSQNDNLRGLILMVLGFFSFAAGDVQAKILTETLHPVQIVWFRQIGLALGIVVIVALRGTHILRSKLPVLQMARGATAVCSAICFILAVTFVPLADVVAVTFIAPFLVTILGAAILRETVGVRRWVAVAIGFLGMLIVIRPGLGVLHPAIGFAVVAAMFFAARQVLSRSLSGVDPVLTTVAYTSLTSIGLVSLALPFVWSTPTEPSLWVVILGLALTAALGEVLVIRALDIAQAVVVTPVHYTLILWGTFYGFFVFGDLPDGWTLLGCCIIIASGLFTLYRERLAMKRARGGT